MKLSLAVALVLSLFIGVAQASGSTLVNDETAAGTVSSGPVLDEEASGTDEGTVPAQPAPVDPSLDGGGTEPTPAEPPVVVAPPPADPAPVEPAPVVPVPEEPSQPPPVPVEPPVVVAPPPAEPAPVEPAPVEPTPVAPAPVAPLPQEPPPPPPPAPADSPSAGGVDPGPLPVGSIVVVPAAPSATPAPPEPPALPPASDAQTLAFEPAATKSMALAEGSSLVFVGDEDESPRPAALKTIKVPLHPSSTAPTPSGAAGAGGSSTGGFFGLFAVLAALLLVPSLVSRLLSLSVELMRPTALVLQLKRPG